MKFRTEIELPSHFVEISHHKKITMMGSCFTEYIGQRLIEEKFDCIANPFGISFNPFSIIKGIQRLQENSPFHPEELMIHNGLWHSFMHHGCFSSSSQEKALQRINESYITSAAHFTSSHLLLITWGSAYIYLHKKTNSIVSNCHKLPSTEFERRILSVEEITQIYTKTLEPWLKEDSSRQIILSISPIRHIRDGLHENQLSKATLLLAADRLQKQYPTKVFYFPAYEILMDELRDYRFYDTDMLHPSPVAKEYIYERFSECCFSTITQQTAQECRALYRMLRHRPIHPESSSWHSFVKQVDLKIKQLQQKYPYLTFNKEIELCHTL